MLLYEIESHEEGIFLERPNRFIAKIKLKEEEVIAHVHDSGRLPELLYAGNKVKLRKANNPNRKTSWDVISAKAEKEDVLINSAFHRYISENLLKNEKISPFGKVDKIKAEVKYGKSRIDFLLEKENKNIWVEVKGVSLSENKVAMFPDAPSVRAQKHLKELMELKEAGHRSAVLLLVLRDSLEFRPKWETDPKFSELFYEAINLGVEVYPVLLSYKNNKIRYKKLIDIRER